MAAAGIYASTGTERNELMLDLNLLPPMMFQRLYASVPGHDGSKHVCTDLMDAKRSLAYVLKSQFSEQHEQHHEGIHITGVFHPSWHLLNIKVDGLDTAAQELLVLTRRYLSDTFGIPVYAGLIEP